MDFNSEIKKATLYTIEFNKNIAKSLGIEQQNAYNSECELARKNCLLNLNEKSILNENGEDIWSHANYKFIDNAKVPDTVNPSLWLNSRTLYERGIFSVVGKDIIQARGFDIANIAFVRSKNGWIVIDSGSTVEGSVAAVTEAENALQEKIRGKIQAVIISHSHGDHFGGIAGILSPNEVGRTEDGKIPLIAPKGFNEATRDEYVYAGKAMYRRGAYQTGSNLPVGETGKVSVGCGLDVIPGKTSYIQPSVIIEEDCTMVIDGITVDFQLAGDTEAVSNMQNYFHEYKALWVADDCIGTLHNLYTIRGAKIRDTKLWVKALYDAYYRYGNKAEVLFQGHGAPHWNTDENPTEVSDVLRNHAAVYQYTHDRTLALISQGETSNEIARTLSFPEVLTKQWYLRPYYATYENNIRAIYQNYLGYYDANPIHLNPLSPKEEAEKFVEYVGSEELVLEKAKKDFEKGNYQYAAQAANAVVFANPKNKNARYLCADALEQLGYQEESAIFRNAYLTGAKELRTNPNETVWGKRATKSILKGVSSEVLIDYLGMTFDGENNSDLHGAGYIAFDDEKKYYYIEVYAGTILKYKLTKKEVENCKDLNAIHITTEKFASYILKEAKSNEIFSGAKSDLWEKIGEALLDLEENPYFNIVEP